MLIYRKEGRFGGWPANHGIWAVSLSERFHNSKKLGTPRGTISEVNHKGHAKTSNRGEKDSIEDLLRPAGEQLLRDDNRAGRRQQSNHRVQDDDDCETNGA